MRVLDGAVGTELARRGFSLRAPDYAIAANEQAPEQLREIYQAYLSAGAEVLTLNSFGLSQGLVLAAQDFQRALAQRAQQAVSLARPFSTQAPLWGALSLGSQKDPGPRLLAEIKALLNAGVSRLRLETLCELDPLLGLQDELLSTLDAAQAQLALSFCPAKQNMTQLLTALETSKLLNYPGLNALGINCVDPHALGIALKELWTWLPSRPRTSCLGIELRPHLSKTSSEGVWQTFALSPQAFVETLRSILHSYPAPMRARTAVGTCCGGGPEHIQALAQAFAAAP